jgi:hypothetical protein
VAIAIDESSLGKQALREVGKLAVSPPMIAFFALALSSPWWHRPLFILLLQSYLVTPNGLIAWAFLAVLGACLAVCWWTGMAGIVKLAPIRRATKACRASGDLEGYASTREIWRTKHRKASRLIFLGMLPVLFLVPAFLAVFFGSDPFVNVVKVHGRYRYATPEENIRVIVKMWERPGIFTPLSRGPG